MAFSRPQGPAETPDRDALTAAMVGIGIELAAPAVSEATRSLRQIGDYIREATW